MSVPDGNCVLHTGLCKECYFFFVLILCHAVQEKIAIGYLSLLKDESSGVYMYGSVILCIENG